MENEFAKIYGLIANKIDEMIPVEWDYVYMLGEVEKGRLSWSVVFYFIDAKTKDMIRCYKIPEIYNVSEKIYNEFHYELSALVLKLNDSFRSHDQELWDQVLFELSGDFKFNIDFNYNGMTEDDGGQIDREVLWAYNTFDYKAPEGNYFRKVLDEILGKKE